MAILRALQSVEYLGAMRRPPERTYVNTGVVGKRIGADGSGWPGILALEGSRARPIGTALVSWLRNAGMADSVSVSWLTDRHYEITVTNPMTAETENIADVGQGTSQVLPVIVGGARLRPGDVYIAEEPEIHLHPRAQAALGDYFVGLIKRRVQALVETHSEYLLLRLQQTIARGDLDPADVVFYYIQSNHGRKEVIQLVLDHNAAFRDQIPGGFFPQRVDEARKLAQARGSRAKGPS
jgi:predicted ATPase